MRDGSKISDSLKSEIANITRTCVIFIVIAIFFKGSIVEAYKIPSSSMEPTLIIDDHIMVNKLSYGFHLPLIKTTLYQYAEPDRGDIVVFTRPDIERTKTDESDINIIKRVIGLPGDVVEVSGTNVFINGQRYVEDEKYGRWALGGQTDFGPMQVPEGRVLLLGDNRDHSKDGRSWEDPFLPIERIKGRAFVIYWNKTFLSERMFKVIR